MKKSFLTLLASITFISVGALSDEYCPTDASYRRNPTEYCAELREALRDGENVTVCSAQLNHVFQCYRLSVLRPKKNASTVPLSPPVTCSGNRVLGPSGICEFANSCPANTTRDYVSGTCVDNVTPTPEVPVLVDESE